MALSLAVGRTFPRGAGVALLARSFQELGLETSFGSRYLVALGQYSPTSATPLTLNAGAGWGRHSGDSPPYASNGAGPVLAAGAALRLPPRGTFALGLTTDVMQSMGGSPEPRLRLLTIGLSLSAASSAQPR